MRIKLLLLSILASILFWSCEDELEKLPLLQTMDGNYYISETQAFEAIVAIMIRFSIISAQGYIILDGF